jgi:hypothetical protein
MIRSRRIRSVGKVEGMGEKINAYSVFGEKARRKETTRQTNTEVRE